MCKSGSQCLLKVKCVKNAYWFTAHELTVSTGTLKSVLAVWLASDTRILPVIRGTNINTN